MRPWAFTGGLQQPITTPSASFFRESWRFKGASGTGERNRGASDSHICFPSQNGTITSLIQPRRSAYILRASGGWWSRWCCRLGWDTVLGLWPDRYSRAWGLSKRCLFFCCGFPKPSKCFRRPFCTRKEHPPVRMAFSNKGHSLSQRVKPPICILKACCLIAFSVKPHH